MSGDTVSESSSLEQTFQAFISERYPTDDDKRSTSGVIRNSFGQVIIRALKTPAAVDKSLRFYVKKHRFQLLDLPSLGVKEVLVVPVKEDVEVRIG